MSAPVETVEQKKAREAQELKQISNSAAAKIAEIQKAMAEEKNPSQKKALEAELIMYTAIKNSADTNSRAVHRQFVDLFMAKFNNLKNE